MANLYGYNSNQGTINQLLRQKDNIENLIQQYSQPQQPIQNIINTVGIEFEARILKDDEDINNCFISRKTMFLDKKNKKVVIKELDGKISEEYEIVIPLDEKDKKILELENRLKEMEGKINDKYSEHNGTTNEQQQSNTNGNEFVKPTTKTNGKSISRTTE